MSEQRPMTRAEFEALPIGREIYRTQRGTTAMSCNVAQLYGKGSLIILHQWANGGESFTVLCDLKAETPDAA